MPQRKMLRLTLALYTRPARSPSLGSQGQGVLGVATPSSAPEETVSKLPLPPAHLPSSLPLALRHPSRPADHASSRCKTRGWHRAGTKPHSPPPPKPGRPPPQPSATPGWRFRSDLEMGAGGS